MTDPESFLTRWSRLKRAQPTASPTNAAPSPTPHAAPASHAAATSHAAPTSHLAPAPPLAPTPHTPPPTVDLATLPPIESLGPGSDISAFLSQGVPPELTQAALRSAWLTDPAIRDFVEIADNQWDFNTPEAIPGFGALGIAQQAKHLVTQALSLADNIPPPLLSPEPSTGNPPNRVVADPIWQVASTPAQINPTSTATCVATDAPAIDAPVTNAPAEAPVTNTPAPDAPAANATASSDAPTPNRRLHGTALPK